jgi:hypothetical protein
MKVNGLAAALGRDGAPSTQPEGESSARRTKENQIKILGFAWFYLAVSGLFNGLRAKK